MNYTYLFGIPQAVNERWQSVTPLACHPELVSGSDDCVVKKVTNSKQC
jgi:hypothetical protein